MLDKLLCVPNRVYIHIQYIRILAYINICLAMLVA
jgi:hypothetical protein